MDHMREALNRRRGKGVDIVVSVQPHGDEKKDSDAAPMAPEHDEMKPDMNASQEAPIASQEDADQGLMEGMSDLDVKDMKSRKPRSLAERVRQDAMERLKK